MCKRNHLIFVNTEDGRSVRFLASPSFSKWKLSRWERKQWKEVNTVETLADAYDMAYVNASLYF